MPGQELSASQLRQLCARAWTLEERQRRGAICSQADTATEAGRVAHRRAEWQRTASNGDDALFALLLRSRGLAAEQCEALFAGHGETATTSLPDWGDCFGWVYDAMVATPEADRAADRATDPTAGCLDRRRPVPFEDLIVGAVVEAALRRDRALAGMPAQAVLGRFSPDAQASLQRILLLRLANLMSEALYRRFHVFRHAAGQQASAAGQAAPDGSRRHYDLFVSRDRGKRLADLFDALPVLARLVGVAVVQWMHTSTEFLERLAGDWTALEREFGQGRALGGVAAISSLDSDPHNGGHVAWSVTFSSGVRVVYKPRPMALEAGWVTVLDWLDAQGAPPSANAAAVLDRGDYGWMAWVAHAPRGGDQTAFFHRTGAMLCLVHLLNGTDLHFENIIADGEAPVAIDLETLLHPRTGLGAHEAWLSGASPLGAETMRDSVVWTGLLPSWISVRNRQFLGIGGLNPGGGDSVTQQRFVHINTDAMRLDAVRETQDARKNLPSNLDKGADLERLTPHLVQGFRAMWLFIDRHRGMLLEDDGPLAAFRSAPIRVILRPTQLYALILKRAQSVAYLVDGAAWSAQFDFLWRFVMRTEGDTGGARLLAEEVRAMTQQDIPYFRTRADGRDLETVDGVVLSDTFDVAPFDQVTRRIRAMHPDDLRFQESLIEQSLGAMAFHPERAEAPQGSIVRDPSRLPSAAYDFDAMARLIAADLRAASVGQKGNEWIGLSPVVSADHSQIELSGFDLYSGAAGMALFFAALERVEGDGVGRDLAARCLAPLLDTLGHSRQRQRLAGSIGIGGGTGLGSIVYGLVHVARLLGEPEYLKVAEATARLIAPEAIRNDRYLDAMDGSAGAIFALLLLGRELGAAWPIERAVLCGRRLVECQVPIGDRGASWHTVGEAPLAGMAHGAAGIGLALLRLSKFTGMAVFADAARRGFEYERALFDQDRGGWPDLRQPFDDAADRGSPILCRWCHGAPGIGLARLSADAIEPDPLAAQEVALALNATAGRMGAAHDGLCCGNFGRIEFMFAAGRKLADAALVERAQHAAAGRNAGKLAAGSFQWSGGHDRFNPGFHTGVAGIGYELLRLAHPDVLPSVLSWE